MFIAAYTCASKLIYINLDHVVTIIPSSSDCFNIAFEDGSTVTVKHIDTKIFEQINSMKV